jgi:hypothetical protein
MRGVGHITGKGEIKNVYNILVRKPERPFRKPRPSLGRYY